MGYVNGPGAAGGTVGDIDSLEGFSLPFLGGRAPKAKAPAAAASKPSAKGIGAALAASRAAARAPGAPPRSFGIAGIARPTPAAAAASSPGVSIAQIAPRFAAIGPNPVTFNAPQLQPAPGEGTMRVLIAAPASPMLRRAFRTMGDSERAQVISDLSQSTGLSGYELSQYSDDDLAGLSFKSIGKAFSNVGKAVGKAVTQTGHVVGNVVTSKIGQAVIGTGLALTGVGLPAAAAIGAGLQAGGGLIKSGGGLKGALTGAAIGGAEGAAASLAGKAISRYAPSVTNVARDVGNAILPGNPFSRISTATAAATDTPLIAAPAAAVAAAAALPPAPAPAAIDTRTAMTTALPAGGVSVQSPTVQRVATQTLAAGTAANKRAKAAAKQVDQLNVKIAALSKALTSAQAAGDALGVSQISGAIGVAQGALATASGLAQTGSDSLRIAGNAAQGAATGAIAGAGAGSFVDWVKAHKALSIGAGVAAAGVLALALAPRRGGGQQLPWIYDPRTRGVA